MNVLGQHGMKHPMVEPIETLGDVSLDEPRHTSPRLRYFRKGRVTAPSRPEAVRAVGELRLVIRFQKGADHFLQQLVRPRRQTQRSASSGCSFLVDVHTPDRGPPIALVPQRIDDRLNLLQAHAVHGLLVGARCHSTGVAVDLPVGTQVQLRIEQVPVQSLQWQSILAAFVDDLHQGFGSLHYAYLASLDIVDTCATWPCKRLSRSPWWGVTPTTTTGTPSP